MSASLRSAPSEDADEATTRIYNSGPEFFDYVFGGMQFPDHRRMWFTL